MALDQATPLGELTVRWTGSDTGDVAVVDEFDGGTGENGQHDPADDPV